MLFNSEITVEEFLADYWQKKPLLFRNAFPGIESPLSADELAGLACEEYSNARLISEQTKPPYWSVEYGPFEESRYEDLPETNWTLLVSDVEKHATEGRLLLDHFRFIPDWRIDDLMMSYAVKGGSVGAHTDAYDVFLLQTQGQRHWHIDSIHKTGCEQVIEGIELRILKTFEADEDWILNPGDMLYLPPDIAHHGIAIDECITCSIGFRAPSIQNLVSEYAESISATLPADMIYEDHHLQIQDQPAEITGETISRIKQLIRDNLRFDDETIKHWFGEYISERNSSTQFTPVYNSDLDITDLSELDNYSRLLHADTSKYLFSRTEKGAILFVDGSSFETSLVFAQTLCRSHSINTIALLDSTKTEQDRSTLLKLFSNNQIYCVR